MRQIVFTDPHISEESLADLQQVFTEITTYKGDRLIMAGDYFEKKRPTAREILFGTEWAVKFKDQYKEVIFLRGNHDKSENASTIDYLQYLGIRIEDEFIDEDNNYFGHFMVNESQLDYGTGKCSIKELAKYNYVILGHQHSFQQITSMAYHLGSCRYVNFNEAKDVKKVIGVTGGGFLALMPLEKPIPMYDVHSLEDLDKIQIGMVKVRLVISSFEQFKKEINAIELIKHKYHEFKVKLDFENITPVKNDMIISKRKKLQDIVTEGIDNIADKEVKKLIKEVYDEV